MFRLDEGVPAGLIKEQISTAEKSYIIKPNDNLEIKVYTNKGEIIIDPNKILAREIGGGTSGQTQQVNPTYLVDPQGKVNLPMIGTISLNNLKLTQADSVLQIAFSEYYEGSYVVSKILNKRVFVLGSPGGQVVPLPYPDMNLIEVLALAGVKSSSSGGGTSGNALSDLTNIRLIRGDLTNPTVTIVNLTTFEGLMKTNLTIQPNDVIYIQPVRRALIEGLREVAPIISLSVQLITTSILIIRSLN